MAAKHLGPWDALTVTSVARLFDGAPFRWWLAGGHALETHAGESWRRHDDTDVGLCRQDAPRLSEVLHGWDIHIAAAGVLSPWDGGPLDPDGSDRAGNNLWCRPTPGAPWALDVLVGDGTEHEWIYRRDISVRRPWPDVVLTTASGMPYLAPEIQLLFKSKTIRPKDEVDAARVIPRLEPARRLWLANHLPPEHPWQTTIAVSNDEFPSQG